GLFFEPAACRVITGVGPVGPNGKRPPVYVSEPAPWSAFRDKEHPYGFAAFTVDPGTRPGGPTTMTVTYYAVTGPFGALTVVDRFTLVRRRRDAAATATTDTGGRHGRPPRRPSQLRELAGGPLVVLEQLRSPTHQLRARSADHLTVLVTVPEPGEQITHGLDPG